jgi:glucokinase
VDFEGRQCVCGNIGCAEAEAAGWSLPGVAKQWPGFAESSLAALQHIGFRELFEHAEQGDVVALAVRQRCLKGWASNAVSNTNAYDPEIVVMGGGVMKSAHIIVPFVQQYVNDHAWSGWGKPEVRAAELGSTAGLLGAVPLLSEDIHALAF